MKITLINHACVKMDFGSVKLLTDPWLFGTCFEGGWGLKYNNPDYINEVKDCTHLWVSHFHTDHFHPPTLKKIVEVNPNIIVFGNHSYNFKMDEVLQKIGFKNVIPFLERKWYNLNETARVQRIPTTGIDNMMIIKTPGGTIVNFNDCNIPLRARQQIAKKIGKVDVFLSNFNSAGKIMDYPPLPDAEFMEKKIAMYKSNEESFNPRYLLPFASFHYYRASESVNQNSILMDVEPIAKASDRVIPVHIGDAVNFADDFSSYEVIKTKIPITLNEQTVEVRAKSYTMEELKEAAKTYTKKIKKHFPLVAYMGSPLNILISDLDSKVTFNLVKGLQPLAEKSNVHIIAHSESLYKWWTKPYGTDSFIVGAHLKITENPMPLKWQILLGLMVENKVDLMSLIKMPFSINGIRFLLNRREELWAIVRKGKIEAAKQR